MKFWDSSAIVPLLVHEPASGWAMALLRGDGDVLVWWGTQVECVSALARHERDLRLRRSGAIDEGISRLRELAALWREVEPTAAVRTLALRLLRSHPLRAADALQLAAALEAGGDDGSSLTAFVCADAVLAKSAEREGLKVLKPVRS